MMRYARNMTAKAPGLRHYILTLLLASPLIGTSLSSVVGVTPPGSKGDPATDPTPEGAPPPLWDGAQNNTTINATEGAVIPPGLSADAEGATTIINLTP